MDHIIRAHAKRALDQVFNEKHPHVRALHTGYASGFAAALLLTDAMTESEYNEFMDTLTAMIKTKMCILRAQDNKAV